MQLTLASIITFYALAQTAAAGHAFRACWLLKGTTTNDQTCWNIDVPDERVGVCSKWTTPHPTPTDRLSHAIKNVKLQLLTSGSKIVTANSLRTQVQHLIGASVAGGADLKGVQVSKPYTCYFFT